MDFVPSARAASTRAVAAVGIFMAFGAFMAGLAGTTLTWRGTALDAIWGLNEPAYRQLAPLGRVVGPLFLLLSAILLLAAVGWFKRRLWGWGLTVAIIATQVAGDLVNLVRGDILRGAIGVVLSSSLLIYLLHPKVCAEFR